MTGRKLSAGEGENHRRGIAVTLGILDEMLCRFEQWADGRELRGCLYQERNGLTGPQREALREEILACRELLKTFRDGLGLEKRTQDAAADIWACCSVLWKDLQELQSRHLRRYGKVPSDLAAFVDRLAPELIRRIERITELVSRSER